MASKTGANERFSGATRWYTCTSARPISSNCSCAAERRPLAETTPSMQLPLPLDAVRRVVRFLSAHPRRRDWAQHVDARDVHALGGLCAEVAQIFDSVTLVGCESPWTEGMRVDARQLRVAVAEMAVRRLSTNGTDAEDLLAACPDVHHLVLCGSHVEGDMLRRILEAHGRSLTMLTVKHASLRLPPPCCRMMPNLIELTLKLDIYNTHGMWRHIGCGLRRLAVNMVSLPMGSAYFHLKAIRGCCRKVCVLDVQYCVERLDEAAINVLRSYGGQLQRCAVQTTNVRLLRSLVASCPNVLVHSVMDEQVVAVAADVLGRQLVSAEVCGSTLVDDWPAALPDLEVLHLEVRGGVFPRDCLQGLLDCDIRYEGQQPTTFIESLARATGCLRTLKFRTGYPEVGALGELVRRNSRLEALRVCFYRQFSFDFDEEVLVMNEPRNVAPLLGDLARAVAVSECMQEVVLWKVDIKGLYKVAEVTRAELDDIFGILRHKFVHVAVNDINIFN